MTEKQKEKLNQVWNTLTDKEKAEYIILQNDCYTHKGNFIRADKVVDLVSQALAEGRKERLEKIKENNIKFNAMTKSEKKNELCRKISNAINLDVHSNVCYMLNFCDMPQEMATELSEHYNAINEIIYEWKNKE